MQKAQLPLHYNRVEPFYLKLTYSQSPSHAWTPYLGGRVCSGGLISIASHTYVPFTAASWEGYFWLMSNRQAGCKMQDMLGGEWKACWERAAPAILPHQITINACQNTIWISWNMRFINSYGKAYCSLKQGTETQRFSFPFRNDITLNIIPLSILWSTLKITPVMIHLHFMRFKNISNAWAQKLYTNWLLKIITKKKDKSLHSSRKCFN